MKKLKTITLCHHDNPSWVICPGHVTQKQFNDAFKAEGWSERGSYKQKVLKYEYWTVKVDKKKGNYYRQSLPGKPGAKPFTVTSWD